MKKGGFGARKINISATHSLTLLVGRPQHLSLHPQKTLFLSRRSRSDVRIDDADPHRAVVNAATHQAKGDGEEQYIEDVKSPVSLENSLRGDDDDDADEESEEAQSDKHEAALPAEVAADRRDPPAVRTAGQRVVQSVEQKAVVAVRTINPAHSRDVGQWSVDRRSRWSEADDSLAIGPGARNALAGVLADEQAVARAPHVLSSRGRVPDGRGLGAAGALDHVLVALAGNVDGALAHPARHHGRSAAHRVVRRRRKLVDRAHQDAAVF
jgi:hypothetical protein